MAGKLVPGIKRHATMAGRLVPVIAALTSIVMYFITVLDIPVEVLLKIDSIRRAFLWVAISPGMGSPARKSPSRPGPAVSSGWVWACILGPTFRPGSGLRKTEF